MGDRLHVPLLPYESSRSWSCSRWLRCHGGDSREGGGKAKRCWRRSPKEEGSLPRNPSTVDKELAEGGGGPADSSRDTTEISGRSVGASIPMVYSDNKRRLYYMGKVAFATSMDSGEYKTFHCPRGRNFGENSWSSIAGGWR